MYGPVYRMTLLPAPQIWSGSASVFIHNLGNDLLDNLRDSTLNVIFEVAFVSLVLGDNDGR